MFFVFNFNFCNHPVKQKKWDKTIISELKFTLFAYNPMNYTSYSGYLATEKINEKPSIVFFI